MDISKILTHYGYPIYGDTTKIVCPFHNDKEASLSVDLTRGMFYCFGCGWKGDAVAFVAQIEKVNRLDALVKISKFSLGAVAAKPLFLPEQPKREWLKAAYLEYKEALIPDWDSGHEITQYMINRGFESKALKSVGVRVIPVGDYPFIIPIRENKKFAGYVKRALHDGDIKYLYNKGFRRQLTLMGNYFPGVVFVTEGVLDYIKAVQFGVKNVVCLLGWKASLQQIEKLQSVTDTIIGALDNDDRGREGVGYLRNYFNVIEFPYPKNVKDIGDMTVEQFKKSRRKYNEKKVK